MAPENNLSEGALEVIMNGGEYPNPIMQILATKKIYAGADNIERYRVVVSDGKNTTSFGSFTLDRDQADSEILPVLEPYSVIQIDKYFTSVIYTSKEGVDIQALLILELTLIASGAEVGEKIGSPVPLPR